jgi:hypothetical protein
MSCYKEKCIDLLAKMVVGKVNLWNRSQLSRVVSLTREVSLWHCVYGWIGYIYKFRIRCPTFILTKQLLVSSAGKDPNSLFSYCYQLQILAAAMFRVPICSSCYYGWCRISKTMLNLLPSAIFTHWILSCFTVNFVEQFWTKLNMACNCDRYNLIEPNGR